MIETPAYTQVSYIISKMSKELKEKIPQEFIDMVERNKEKEKIIDIENVEQIDLLEDTKKILSVIYTDYIATDEERNIIKNKERILTQKKEEEKKANYNTEMFKNKGDSDKNTSNKKDLPIVQPKEKWYKIIFRKIKRTLGF